MPIVSEHPLAAAVIQQLSDDCDSEMSAFLADYTKRRSAYNSASDTRRSVVRRLDDEDRPELSCRELMTLLRSRESAAEDLRVELELMDKELMLLKREMRRVRRRLVDAGAEDVPASAPVDQPVRETSPRLQDIVGQIRQQGTWAWLRPWLSGFIPGSA